MTFSEVCKRKGRNIRGNELSVKNCGSESHWSYNLIFLDVTCIILLSRTKSFGGYDHCYSKESKIYFEPGVVTILHFQLWWLETVSSTFEDLQFDGSL